jgi:hypothetical protein
MERTTAVRALVVLVASTLLATGRSKPLLQQPPAIEVARTNPYQQLDHAQRERAAKAGQKLFQRECSACHGPSAEGTRTAPQLYLSNATPGVSRGHLLGTAQREPQTRFAIVCASARAATLADRHLPEDPLISTQLRLAMEAIVHSPPDAKRHEAPFYPKGTSPASNPRC